MGRIYTLVNQKGGVGKTTTAINLGAYLAQKNQRVLLIDLDPQANATSCLGIDRRNVPGGTYDVLLNTTSPLKFILHNPRLKLSILPSSPALAGAEVELVPEIARESRLLQSLKLVIERYDYILIDCPPSLGLLTLNALTASNSVLIPVQCEYFALEGLGQLLNTINIVKQYYNPDLTIEGVLLTMFDTRLRLSHQVAEEVRKYFGEKVFNTVINRNVRISEAPSFGKPIILYDAVSTGAQNYMAFAAELIERNSKPINT